jgi:hypothetical protein
VHFLLTSYNQNEDVKQLHEVLAFCSTLVYTFNQEHRVDQKECIERYVELRGLQAP